jgi:hypothetical protein
MPAMSNQNPAFGPQAGSLPEAAPVPAKKRLEKIGLVCMILGLLEVLFSLLKVAGPITGTSGLETQKKIFESFPAGKGAPPMSELFDAAADLVKKITMWEAGRGLLFLAASGYLVWIAIRLQRGEAQALHAARSWTWWALGVVALSAMVQVMVTVPATLEYTRRITSMLPMPPASSSGGAPPFDVKKFMETITLISTIVSVGIGSIVMSIWPVALYVWAGKLVRALEPAPEG